MNHYATIVLGGGTMGTAAAWQLGLRGESAVVLEQFSHVHSLGAHGGQTRVFRHAYAEDPDYVPFVLRADSLWTQLEEETGQHVLHRVGVLELANESGGHHAERARQSAVAYNLDFDWIDADEIRRRWPQFKIGDGWQAGFGGSAGFLEVEPALHAMGRSARANGVEIRENSRVTDWGSSDHGVWVDTSDGRVTGDRLIVTAGPWAWKMLEKTGVSFYVLRKTLWWMEVAQPDRFAYGALPVFMADHEEFGLYGFPIFGQPGLKYANHQGGTRTDPDSVERTTTDEEAAFMVRAGRWLFGDEQITGNVLKSAVCMYAMTPDGHFIIDRLPGYPNVTVGAGFSGHGFKFATAVGEKLVNLAYDREERPLELLSIDRFAAAPA
ncbi:MAG: N-methyl-L-tryptophan oxidase [Thermomicrobiales bacterium]|nr:N-methyl-L-tryptophan oxidase [Thermomicrobiales bacterium]